MLPNIQKDGDKPMNAIKFIQQHGVDKAREVVEGAPTLYCDFDPYDSSYMSQVHQHEWEMWKEDIKRWDVCEWDVDVSDYILVSDLKRLVESVELVKEHYTLDRAKSYAESPYTAPEIKERLEQAIADYAEIYKCTYCNGFGEVGCQFEGTFTCPDCNGDRYVGGEHV